MNKSCLFSLLAAIISLTAFADTRVIQNYDLHFAAPHESNLISLELTPQMMTDLGGHPNYLRISDSKGTTVPYLLTQMQTPCRQIVRAGEIQITKVRTLNDGSLELLGETKDALWNPAHLTFSTSVRDFEQEVKIYGRVNSGDWQLLCDDGFIFDSSSILAAKNLDITFNPGDCREFRIVLTKASLERQSSLRSISKEWSESNGKAVQENYLSETQAFKLDKVTMWSEQLVTTGHVMKFQETSCTITAQRQETNADGIHSTVITLTPSSYPVSGLTFNCQSSNFSRRVKIHHTSSAHSDRLLADAQLRSVHLGGYELNERSVTFPEINDGSLTVTLLDGDNPPLSLTSISARIPCYQLYFLCNRSNHDGFMLSGTPGASAPIYDLGDLQALLSAPDITREIATATSGNRVSVDISHLTKEKWQFPQWLLYLIIFAVVAVLGLAIYHTMKNATAATNH